LIKVRRLNLSDLDGYSIPRYIVVEGPIGAGKTTLTQLLAESLNYNTLLERADENPFLERFYNGEKNAALSTQLFFLMQRAQQLNQLSQGDMFTPVQVADFLIEKDRLFAELTLDEDELTLYKQVYQHMTIDAPKPDLVVYLQAAPDVLIKRIHQRGINTEQSIDINYLERINDAYSRFFLYYDDAPLLIVNGSDIDFANKPEDFNDLVRYMLSITGGRHYYNPQPSI